MAENQIYAEWATVLTGLALGCLATDTSRFPTDRGHFERALRDAWPGWPGKDAYGWVRPKEFGIYGIRSTLMHPSGYATWEWSHGIRPALAVDSAAPDDVLAQFAADQPVGVEAWRELARAVTQQLPAPDGA